ncbi:DUF3592 domain-containing protein [Carboxylicivirga sp. N1Y90]|uniref:DUF3592 domain-containing protein n=1 Tax=Carboxylicivirga fragile TaxID=3417571 RepID=UPI003D350B83|nr:hypothetical protein [Marinilabiliaceae bacterium N1Y90]
MQINLDIGYTEIFALIIIALILVYILFAQSKKKKRLMKSGIRVEGFVIDIKTSYGGSTMSPRRTPIVRFLTVEDRWIESEVDFISRRLKLNQEVTVYYNGNDPYDFIVV